MEPILDETSLVPWDEHAPSRRIRTIATTLRALDVLGTARVLRSTQDAADRDIGGGRGLRAWCFDAGTDRDSGRLVAGRLGRQPFIDGAGGLLSTAEGNRAVEGYVGTRTVLGLAFAALNDNVAVALEGAAESARCWITVALTCIDDEVVTEEEIEVLCLVTSTDVAEHRDTVIRRIDSAVSDGPTLLARASEMFSSLRFGPLALQQIGTLTGRESTFRQLIRHLRALDLGARHWEEGAAFAPGGALSWNVESRATLQHGKLGPMRDFPVPAGFVAQRWSLHTKLTGGAGARLYFRPERTETEAVVLVGYVGRHLPTVRHMG